MANRIILSLLLISLLSIANASMQEKLKNPVARCADAGVMNFCGEYFISGVGLPGQFLISPDLVEWQGPVSFFQTKADWLDRSDEKEMHAPGMRYINGKFYFYWNGIGYATAEKLLGPYKENSKRFDNEIDPFLFVDDDGKLFFYTVKYTDGNVICGQEMAAPDKLIGKSVLLISAVPNSWEWRDWKVNEGPEVIKYRDTYYLLYAANVTSVEMANYLVGCAQSKTPLGFRNKNKYPWPVMEQSDERIFDEVETIIPWGANGGPKWNFTTNKPAGNWMMPNFKTSKTWEKKFGAFGSPIRQNSRIHDVTTLWNSDDIWTRLEFTLPEKFSTNLQLKVRHLDSAEFYLNGNLVHSNLLWAGPRLVNLKEKDIAKLHPGKNIIAVHCHSKRNEKYLDVGLIDPGNKKEDDIIWNTGQPNVLKGPNGFEWFVIYFAMWNEGPHCQGINRVFFFDKELYIDGPTGSNPPQYQPPPYKATFSDNFTSHKLDGLSEEFGEDWEYHAGIWYTLDGEARVSKDWLHTQTPDKEVFALVRAEPAENYIFELWTRPLKKPENEWGIMAWYADKSNYQKIYFSPSKKALISEISIKGKIKKINFPVGKSFDFSAFHKIRFEKNYDCISILIDDVNITRNKKFKIPFGKKGRPGLLANKQQAAFDGVVYTIGWDEFDKKICGWKKISPNGEMTIDNNGINLKSDAGKILCVKGDFLKNYEFSTQIKIQNTDHGLRTTEYGSSKSGIYPVYIDENNYLAAWLSPKEKSLVISGKRNGNKIKKEVVNLEKWERLYLRGKVPKVPENTKISASHCWKYDTLDAAADGLISKSSRENIPKFSFWDHRGTKEWIQYNFQSTKKIDCSEVIWYDDTKDGGDCQTPESWELFYKDNTGSWQPVKLKKNSSYGTEINKLNLVEFEPVKTSAMKMKVTAKNNKGAGLYEWTVIDSKTGGREEEINLYLKRVGIISELKINFDKRKPFDYPVKWTLQYKNKNQKWENVETITQTQNEIKFKKIETNQLRLKYIVKPGSYCRVVKTYTKVEWQPSYNIRSVKLSDKVIIFIDGKEKIEIPGAWAKSKVGIAAENCTAEFNGITCFWIE